MKRSQINTLIQQASQCFSKHGWALPPNPRWDVTDFSLGDPQRFGLVLVNLAEEPEYCEKLMYARKGMITPAHSHGKKKEDIICRWGRLGIQLWPCEGSAVTVRVNGEPRAIAMGGTLELDSGHRVTLLPGVIHEFVPLSDECIIGEVSTANDDLSDNFFVNEAVGRFSEIEEDEPPITRLISD